MARRLHLVALVLALCVSAVPALAGPGKSRTETGEYNTLTVEPDTETPALAGQFANGVSFETRKGERFVSVVIKDDTGMPVRAVLEQDFDDDGTEDLSQEICSATTTPVKIRPAVPVVVSVQEGACADGYAVATFGTVTATFTGATKKHSGGHHHH